MQVNVKDFNEIIKYFEETVLHTFTKDSKSLKNFIITCNSDNIDYLLQLDIDRKIKMSQLRTMYLNASEIENVKKRILDPISDSVTYTFNKVGGKEISTHHKKGGCLTRITFYKNNIAEELSIIIHFRASVAPYNLYYDLIMLNELFEQLGINEIKDKFEKVTYLLQFEEIKGKPMQNFFYYISAGFYDNKEDFESYDYGKIMLDQYNIADKSNYKSTKRFHGKCTEAMIKRNILN